LKPDPDLKPARAVAAAGAWCQALPASLREALLGQAQLRRLAHGERLFARGDAPDGLYCVASGAMRITGTAESGKEALLAIAEPPQWFGEIALFDRQPRTHDAWAEGATALLHIPQPALIALLEKEPAYWREFALLLTQKLRVAFTMLEDATLLSASGRLVRRLIAIAEGYGEWKDRSRRVIHVPQEQLGLMLALSRQTVNQILRQLEAQGAVRVERGAIEILDIGKLRGLAA
jgi:CRP-like cAMP-binding protein